MLKRKIYCAVVVLFMSSFFGIEARAEESHAEEGVSKESTSRDTNRFSAYDALKSEVKDQDDLIKRIKWYRERVAESCEASDKSSKLMAEYLDSCIAKDAKRAQCKATLAEYFKTKRAIVGDAEYKKYAVDWEMDAKFKDLFDLLVPKSEIKDEPIKDSKMIEELKKTSKKNLCQIENVKKEEEVKKDVVKKEEPKKEEVAKVEEKVADKKKEEVAQQGGYKQPAGGYVPPKGGYTPPKGGYTPPAGGYTPPAGGYTPPAGGYQYGNQTYDPLSARYDSRRPYRYDNFKNYEGNDYNPIPYLPNMNYPKGDNYQPPVNQPAPYLPPPPVDRGPDPLPVQYPVPPRPYPPPPAFPMMPFLPPPPPPPVVVGVDIGFSIESGSSYRPYQVVPREPNPGLGVMPIMGCQNLVKPCQQKPMPYPMMGGIGMPGMQPFPMGPQFPGMQPRFPIRPPVTQFPPQTNRPPVVTPVQTTVPVPPVRYKVPRGIK